MLRFEILRLNTGKYSITAMPTAGYAYALIGSMNNYSSDRTAIFK
ncbi:MAG: hypothetical protein V7L20_29525 [Nostoc sp.]